MLRRVIGIEHVIHQQAQTSGLLRCHGIHIVDRCRFPDAKQFLGRNHTDHDLQIFHQGRKTLVHDPAAELIEQAVDPTLGHLDIRIGIRIDIGVGVCIGVRHIIGVGDNIHIAVNINVNIHIDIDNGKYIHVYIDVHINIHIRIYIGVHNGVCVFNDVRVDVRIHINIHIHIHVDRIDVFTQLRNRIGRGGLAGKLFIDGGHQLAEIAVEKAHPIGHSLQHKGRHVQHHQQLHRPKRHEGHVVGRHPPGKGGIGVGLSDQAGAIQGAAQAEHDLIGASLPGQTARDAGQPQPFTAAATT